MTRRVLVSVTVATAGLMALLGGCGAGGEEPTRAGSAPNPSLAMRDLAEQEQAPEDYFVRQSASGAALVARNPAHSFFVRYGNRRVAVQRGQDVSRQVAFEVSDFGCADAPQSIVRRTRSTDRNRVAFAAESAAGTLSEWYLNGPLGLEQGFTIPREPRCAKAANTKLEIGIEFDAGTSLRQQSQTSVALRSVAGLSLEYRGLAAFDAKGRALPAVLEVHDQRLALLVETASATFPIWVDPLIVSAPVKLLGDHPEPGDRFGVATALTLDGKTAVTGAEVDSTQGIKSGTAYVYEKGSGGIWAEAFRITPPTPLATQFFGHDVAIDQNTVIVGAMGESAAYIYVRQGGGWVLEQRLAGVSGSEYGSGVAVRGDTAVVGARAEQNGGKGAVYVYHRGAGSWTLLHKIPLSAVCSSSCSNEAFGWDVNLSDDGLVLLASSPFRDATGPAVHPEPGGVVVFRRASAGATQFTYEDTLWDPDIARLGEQPNISGDTVVACSAWNGGCAIFERSAGTWARAFHIPQGQNGSGSAISGDVAAIADRGAANITNKNGKVDIYKRSAGVWSLDATVQASDGIVSAHFGWSVALSNLSGADKTMFVGAPVANTYNYGVGTGAAYFYDYVGATFGSEQKVFPDAPEAGDQFGAWLHADGDTVLVGAPGDDSDAGAVYVFDRSGNTWSQSAILSAADRQAGDRFGQAVFLHGDLAIIGANQDDGKLGAAYVFSRSAGVWAEDQRLEANLRVAGELFGTAVATDGTTIVVGAEENGGAGLRAGAAYVFSKNGSTWQQDALLQPSEVNEFDRFGGAVGVVANTLVVAARNALTASKGAVFVYDKVGATWTKGQVLTTSGSEQGGRLLYDGNTILIGSLNHNFGAGDTGSFASFVKTGSNWAVQDGPLKPADIVLNDQFGSAIGLSGDIALVGAHLHDQFGADAGEGYIFTRKNGKWLQGPLLAPIDAAPGDNAGAGAALLADTAFLGVPNDDELGQNAGVVWVYDVARENGDACDNDNQCVSGFCTESVCCDKACGGECESCLQARGAPTDGVCTPVPKAAPALPTACTSPYQCNGSDPTCPTSCNNDDSCIATFYCESASGQCKPQLDLAADCSSDGDSACKSGHCEDGVCCDKECGACQACTGLKKGDATKPDGICGPTPVNKDADDDCAASPNWQTTCGPDGMCNGQGQCRAFAPTTWGCGSNFCDTATNTSKGLFCKGDAAVCVGQPGGVACAPYLCDVSTGGCAQGCTTGAECAADAYCTVAKVCEFKKDNGQLCTESDECNSAFCVDGVCCNTECKGQCAACDAKDVNGNPTGICNAVEGQPHGDRPQCDAATPGQPCTARRCDGVITTSCAGYASTTTDCSEPSCTDGVATPAGRCDGKGSCEPVGALDDCAPYVCGANACKKSCVDNGDCSDGGTCTGGKCVSGLKCTDDKSASIDLEGKETSCLPYLCEAGQCRQSCEAQGDCAAGFLCNSDSQCVQEASVDSSGDGSGCSCSAVGSSKAPPMLPLAGLLLALMLRRRRRAA